MKGVYINIKKLKPNKESVLLDYLVFAILLVVIVVLSPIILFFYLLGLIIKLVMPDSDYIDSTSHNYINLENGEKLSYRYISTDEQTIGVAKELDGEAVIEFDSQRSIDKLGGLFTTFIIERDDGVFLQKIEVGEHGNVISMPLIFYNNKEKDVEILKDLKGYEIYTKGGKDNFAIIGFSDQNEIEIQIKK